MNDKPKIKKPSDGREEQLRRMIRGLQKLAAEFDEDAENYALELAREIESKRRRKKAVANLGEKV